MSTSLAKSAERLAELSAQAARLAEMIIAGMEEREAEMRAIWAPKPEAAS